MPLSPGFRIGSYEITGLLGVGGMGEVYRAADTKLKRQVALKVLPDSVATDPDRLSRFQREAEVLASLNHPHIAQIYGVEDAGATRALVMELVEGPTLADRIADGALPLNEALPIARQIAEALETAHEQGIVHRDLKPANIKVRPDGTVKVLDFGLAKALDAGGRAAPSSTSLSMSPTLASPAMLTGVGLILGTAAYMSPEQARGRAADRRSDIWAFGCVLFEMLTARRAFDAGETVSDAVAAILTHEPDWSALPAGVPRSIRTLLRRCLQKDPQKRLPHIGVARLEVDDAPAEAVDVAAHATTPSRPSWLAALPWVVASLAIGTAAWAWLGRPAVAGATDSPVRRMEVNLPDGVELFTSSTRTVAISPDGSRLAFVGNFQGTRQVFVRALDTFEAIPLKGSDGATSCFFSRDGESIGFVTASGTLRTISLTDGLMVTAGDSVSFLLGAAWGQEGVVFVRSDTLWLVRPGGGTARQLTTLGGPNGDTQHAWPNVLPDGQTVLFGARSGERSRIEALDVGTGKRQVVVDRGTLPLYSASGHLMFFRDGELLAAPFDVAGLQLTGQAVKAISGLPAGVSGVPVVDASASGTVVYAPTTAVSRLVWVSREGAEQPANDTVRNYANPRLSPNGDRIVVQAGDVWVQDLARNTFTRFSPRMALENGFPIWSPDGRTVLFRSAVGIRTLDADGSGREQTLAGTTEWDYPASITPDGETLVIQRRTSEETSFDTYAVPLRDPLQARPLLKTPAYEGGARLSPDGRFLTYISNESGKNEVYLRPFPGPDRRWQVSTAGGTQAIWSPDQKEIFYRDGNRMMAVEVTTSPDVSLSPPRQLFEQRYAYGAGITIANFDVTRDGKRFLMVKDEASAGRLHVVMNWFSDLARRAPADAP